jgi:hypothetical protein
MPRRFTGCVLAAVLIGVGSVTALSSVLANGGLVSKIEPAVPSLADLDQDYVGCVEIMIGREPLLLRDGKVVLLQPGMTSADLMKVIQGERPLFHDADAHLIDELIRAGRVRFDTSKLTWPSLPAGELLPDSKKPRNLIGAACGIPPGMTFLAPAVQGFRRSAAT